MRELQALVAPNPPQGVLVRCQAGLVINKFFVSHVKDSSLLSGDSKFGKVDLDRIIQLHIRLSTSIAVPEHGFPMSMSETQSQ